MQNNNAVLSARKCVPRGPGILHCALALCAIRVALLTRGFHRTRQSVIRAVESCAVIPGEHDGLVTRVTRTVAFCAALYPGRARCLEQSLTVYYLLRRCGVSVEWRLGVQPYRFKAHAWIEYKGRPVQERGRTEGMVCFPEMPA